MTNIVTFLVSKLTFLGVAGSGVVPGSFHFVVTDSYLDVRNG